MKLKMGIPQGRLQAPIIELFKRAGFDIRPNGNSYYPSVDDAELECVLIRAEEMPRYIAEGIVDAGITSDDWIQECEAVSGSGSLRVIEDLICPTLGLWPVRWVLAVSEASEITSVNELEGMAVSSELLEVTQRWFADHGVNARVTFSWGATELKPPALAAAIVQPETAGSRLREHNLRTIATIIDKSHPRLVCRRSVLNEESPVREKLYQVRVLLMATIAAQDKVRLVVETDRRHQHRVESLIDAVVPIVAVGDGDTITLNAIVLKATLRDVIPRLRAAGAGKVVETLLNKFVP